MPTAGARVLPEDDQQDMSREAVLLQWERKIEAAERRPGRCERERHASLGRRGGRDRRGACARTRTPPTRAAALRAQHAGSRRRSRDRGGPGRAAHDHDHRPSHARTAPALGGRTARWPSRTGSPCGRSCWAFSWWPWPPGPRTPEPRRRAGTPRRSARSATGASTLAWKALHFPTTLTAGKSHAEREAHEDEGEQVPGPRRAHRSRAQRSDPQGCAVGRWPAPELHRRARRIARRAARLRAVPLRAPSRRAALRHPAAHRARGRRAPESEYALSTLQRTARDAGLGLDEIALAREFDSRDEREVGPDALRQGAGARRRARRRGTCTRRRARRAGTTSRSSRRSPTWRWRPSGTWSPAQATCRRTARAKSPACSRPRRFSSRACRGLRCTAMASSGPWSLRRETCCSALPPGRRAGGQALDRRHPVRAHGRARPLLRGQAARARPLRPAAVRADEGARGRGHRRAPRDRRDAGQASSTR